MKDKIFNWLMHHKKVTLTSFFVSIFIFIVLILFLFSLCFIYFEAKNEKPFCSKEFVQDCRIVNNIASLKENKELRVYSRLDSADVHVIALNEDGKIIDKSNKYTHNNNNESIEEFEKNKSFIKDFLYKNGEITIYNYSFDTFTNIYYFYMFRYFYSHTH